MPWRECNRMDERLKFIARLLDGEKMSALCREFGISRPTGYKIFNRYKDFGVNGLEDRSRRPYRQANQLPFQIERTILRIKQEHPSWGAPKIREKLLREYPMIKPPAKSTVHAVLDRHGLVKRRKRRRHKAKGTALNHVQTPNGLWCADYKGEFRLGNKHYCYPLTISDYHSRYLLACEGLESTRSSFALAVFERVFKEYGLPHAIRTDNGIPFSAPNALFGLSHLSVWWLRLGIQIERIKPGHPQQNGRHERIHLTLKKETTRPAAFNFLQQQARFDDFVTVYNHDRPHQALNMKYPGEVYTPSTRVYRPLDEPEYPFHDRSVRVTQCGRICIGRRKINFSIVFAGQTIGIREVADNIWLVSFMQYDLGYFDDQADRVEP
ncbi:MAG: IS481 family transposase, partial [Gammaproteobacteria bacterium]|nr:IS481 family transposase [Gammaproteobacteria bacterium]